ncbi:MAG: CidA/LrgA family protein [Ruminococcaceae bacterium]|nr:CidA/LrgA family protein [Oscillospiraceae bacterium]
MKYIKQFGIILIISFLGELCNFLIPLPVPASIYGLLLMLFCLCTKLIRVQDVRETSHFLIEIMPLMFIPAAVGLLDSWGIIRRNLVAYAVIMTVTTVIVMVVSGLVTQAVLRLEKKRRKDHGTV